MRTLGGCDVLVLQLGEMKKKWRESEDILHQHAFIANPLFMTNTTLHSLLQSFIRPVLYFLLAFVAVAGLFSSCKKDSACNDCVDVDGPPAINDTARRHHAPLPDAGNDHTIMLPATISVLDGSGSSDPDNNIKTYLWSKISGPSSFHIVNTDTVITQVEHLQEGVYQFELRLTDSSGLSDSDTVQVVVMKQRDPCTDT